VDPAGGFYKTLKHIPMKETVITLFSLLFFLLIQCGPVHPDTDKYAVFDVSLSHPEDQHGDQPIGQGPHSDSAYSDSVLNRKAEGYSGIWYMNTVLDSEYRYKYSGGLGTYCAKHRPMAIYAPEVNKTFFCFGAAAPDLHEQVDLEADHPYPSAGLLYHGVGSYDHATGMLSRPTLVMDKGTGDAHDNPVISIDERGFIWIFSTSHGRQRPSYIHRSEKPYDIETFVRIPAVQTTETGTVPFDNFSYFQPWHIPGRGFIVFATKYGYPADRTPCFLTSTDGIRWSKWNRLAVMGSGHYQVSGTNGKKAGTMMNYHPVREGRIHGLNFRTNLYYLETCDFGESWQAADGTSLQLPLTGTDNPALVRDYRADSLLVYLKDLQYDAGGNPLLLYITSRGYESGPRNNPRTWTLARWTGNRWIFTEITTSDNNYDSGELILLPGRWLLIAPTERGPQPYNTGGEVALWESPDEGISWNRTKMVTLQSRYNHTYVRRVIHGRPGFLALWADGHGRQPSPSRLYFTNVNGELFQMPVSMESNLSAFAVSNLPTAPDKESVKSLMDRVNSYQLEHPWREYDDNWIRGTYYAGVMACYLATGDESYLRQCEDFCQSLGWKLPKLPPESKQSGANLLTCGQTMLECYMVKREAHKIENIVAHLEDPSIRNPVSNPMEWYHEGGRRYVDGLFTGPPALAMLYAMTGKEKYLCWMEACFWDVYGKLFDREENLFYRDHRFMNRITDEGREIIWSRGNGWAFAGIARILKYLPEDYPNYQRYRLLFREMAASLKSRQSEEGFWYPNLADPQHIPLKETSGTGFFVYGLAYGINQGILEWEEYIPVAEKAWSSLCDAVSREGKVEWGQPVGYQPVMHRQEDSHEYVTGTFLLAASEIYKMKE